MANYYGEYGGDRYLGGSGADSINGVAGNDTLAGGSGVDTIWGGTGHDSIDGGSGDDTLLGEEGDDYLVGGSGSDTLDGAEGADTLDGGSGDDRLAAGAGNDQIIAGSGRDTVSGGLNDDRVDGGADNDSLAGDEGADTIVGGSGDDIIAGGRGDDRLEGGTGRDSFLFKAQIEPAGGYHVAATASTGPLGETIPQGFTRTAFAQSFVALGEHADSVTLYLTANPTQSDPGLFTFRLLIQEVPSQEAGPQGPILYASEPVILEYSANYIPRTFDLSGMDFTTGKKYAFVIDTVSVRDGVPDVGGVAIATPPGDALPEGNFYLTGDDQPWYAFNFDMAMDIDFHNGAPGQRDVIADFSRSNDKIVLEGGSAGETILRDVAAGTEIVTEAGVVLLQNFHALAPGETVSAAQRSFDWIVFS